MLFYGFLGFLFGLICMGLFCITFRKALSREEEEKRLLAEERQRVIDFIHDLIEGLSEGVSKDELYKRILHGAVLGTGALSACLYELRNNGNCVAVCREGLFPPLKTVITGQATRTEFLQSTLCAEEFTSGEGVIGEVIARQQLLHVSNAENDSRIMQHSDNALKINALIATPICFRGKIFGVLCVVNPTRSKDFSKVDISLIQSLSEQAGMAIHNAQLVSLQIEKNKLDFDLKLAQNIQTLLLTDPELIHLPETDIGIYYRSAQKIGGDLYDVVPLSDKTFAVFIADVSGKGIPASLLMTMCLTHLKHYAYRFNSPRETLIALNKHLYSEIRKDMFITMVCAMVNTSDNTITIAKAGHEPPILYSASKNITIVRTKGMALGMVDNNLFQASLEEATYRFARNDGCVLYTDGVTEALNSKEEEFSQTHLIDVIQHNSQMTAKALNASIMENVQNFSGSKPLSDDLTLITLRRL